MYDVIFKKQHVIFKMWANYTTVSFLNNLSYNIYLASLYNNEHGSQTWYLWIIQTNYIGSEERQLPQNIMKFRRTENKYV